MYVLWSQIYTHSLFWFISVLPISENVPQTHCIRMRKRINEFLKKRIRILDTLTFSKESWDARVGASKAAVFF